MSRPLYRPSRREAIGLAVVALVALTYGFAMRYGLVENSAAGIACETASTLLCASRRSAIALFQPQVFGLVALAYMWAQMAKAANAKLKAGANGSEERMKAKLVTGKFFMERVLPESAAHLKRIQTGADTMMALATDAF